MARKLSALNQMQERAFWRDWQEMCARESADLPPMPDPERDPAGYGLWMMANARQPSAQWRELAAELRNLPTLRYRRARDREVWGWISHLLVIEGLTGWYDLRTCALGANPANANARPGKMLRALGAVVAEKYPGFGTDRDLCRLFDAIRHWRRRARNVSTIEA